MRLVIDTNIIVSALLSIDGTAFQVLSDVLDGKYAVFISKEMFQFDNDIVEFVLNWFLENAIRIEVSKSNIPMPDEKDRVFFDVAKCCKAKLVTGNVRHYPVDELVTLLWELK